MRIRYVFLLLICVIGSICIWAKSADQTALNVATKPVTTILIMFLLLAAGGGVARYRPLILAGLVFSLGGDVCLMFESAFLAGLGSFLIAHLFYIGAFSLGTGFARRDVLLAIPFLAFGIAMFTAIKEGVDEDVLPVLVYTMAISVMGWRATIRCLHRRADLSGLAALAGALLFIASDSMLAWDRFAAPIPRRDLLVMTTYWLAQTLIAMSVAWDAEPSGARP